MVYIVAIILSFTLFIIARKIRINVLNEELKAKIRIPASIANNIDIGFVAGISIYEAIHNIIMIDDRVIDGLDFSSTKDLTSFNELSGYLQDHVINVSDASSNGFISRLQGYASEQIVAAHFVSAGHVVNFPENANNPGWDMLVDGHPIQVKDTIDPSLIKEHLIKYPDIPVVTNTEMAKYFEGHNNVMIDYNLNHDIVLAKVNSTVEGIHGLSSDSLFHIPMITLAVSSFKEMRLLCRGDTDWATAGKHVALDVAGVGTGGVLGGKIGLFVGGIFGGPIGAAVGSVAGSIGGAVLGKLFTNEIKFKEYYRTIDNLNNSLLYIAKRTVCELNVKSQQFALKLETVYERLRLSILSFIWPDRKYMVYNNFKSQVEDQMFKIKQLQQQIIQLLNVPLEQGQISLAGQIAYEATLKGSVFYPELNKDLDNVQSIFKQLEIERKKLGK